MALGLCSTAGTRFTCEPGSSEFASYRSTCYPIISRIQDFVNLAATRDGSQQTSLLGVLDYGTLVLMLSNGNFPTSANFGLGKYGDIAYAPVTIAWNCQNSNSLACPRNIYRGAPANMITTPTGVTATNSASSQILGVRSVERCQAVVNGQSTLLGLVCAIPPATISRRKFFPRPPNTSTSPTQQGPAPLTYLAPAARRK